MAKKQKGFGFNISLGLDQFNKDCKSVQKAFGDLFGKDVMDLSKGAAGAIAGIGAALSGIAVAAYNFGSKMDALKTNLTGVWGSAEQANKQYARLRQISENSSFGLDQLQKLDATMASLGLDSDSAAEMVSRLADLGTKGGNMEAMSDALLNIKTSGVVSAKALKEFARAGIDVSDVIGMDATTALNTLMERMNKFDGYLEGEATDIWSQIPRMVKIVEDAMASLGNYINDNFSQYFVAAGNVVSDLRDRFESLLNDEGGLAQLEEAVIDVAEAITIMALPALGQLAVGFIPVVVKAGAFILALEAIRDIMRAFRGESSIILTTFKAVFSQLGSWVMSLAEKVAEFNVDVMEMAMRASSFVPGDGTAMAVGKAYDAAVALRKQIRAWSKPVHEQTEEFWKEWDKDWQKFSDESVVGRVFAGLGSVYGSYEGQLGAYQLGGKAQKPTKVNRVTANSVRSAATALAGTASSEGDGFSVWTAGKEIWSDFKNAAIECYQTIQTEAQPVLDALARQNEWTEAGTARWNEWTDSMKAGLANGFADSLTTALFASQNFFESIGEGLKNLGKEILAEIAKMLILTTLMRALGIHSGSIPGISTVSSWKTGSIHDGIVQNGKVVTTDPQDYIVATKNPSSLGGGSNVVVNVTNNNASQNEVKTTSHFDGTKEIINIVIEGLTRNVNGFKDTVRAIL